MKGSGPGANQMHCYDSQGRRGCYPLGQRPLCVFPVDYRVWASAFMIQQKKWFRFWVPDWVYSAGGGRSSVEAWYTTASGIGDVLASAVYFHVHFLVAYGTKSFVTVDRFFFFWIGFSVVWLACLVSACVFSSIMHMFACTVSLQLELVSFRTRGSSHFGSSRSSLRSLY